MTKHFDATFAMSFTHEEVVLEKRAADGWRKLGSVRFSRGDLGQQLTIMRQHDNGGGDSALAGRPDTLLVIPDDQILYTTLTVPPSPEPGRAVARALEGLTPYEVKDLAFDWAPAADGDADSLRVAAVARRTLEEAESFALDQGFQPAGFVGRPGDDRFPGQPDFGASMLLRDLDRRGTVTTPDLRSAGVTAASIAVLPDGAPASGQVISRITPHVATAADEPAPQTVPAAIPAKAMLASTAQSGTSRQVVSEFVAPAPRAQMVEPNRRPLRTTVAERQGEARAPRSEPVIRHRVEAPANPDNRRALPPRAEAVHNRAADARARRAAEPKAEDRAGAMALLAKANRMINTRLPSTFSMMLGLLIAALLVTLVFFGGGEPRPEADAVATVQPAPAIIQPDLPAPQVAEAALPEEPAVSQAVIEDTTEPQNEADLAGVAPETLPASSDVALAETAPAPPSQTIGRDAAVTAALAEAQADLTDAAAMSSSDMAMTDPATEETPSPAPPAPPAETRPAATPTTEAVAEDPASTARPEAAPQARPEAPPAASEIARSVAEPAPLRTLALARSARPAPPPSRAAAPAPNDSAPVVPANPQPFSQRAEPAPVRLSGIRPPSRPARSNPAQAPASQPVAQPTADAPAPAAAPVFAPAPAPAADSLQRSTRPPSRPSDLSFNLLPDRGAAHRQTRLTADDIRYLEGLLLDLRTAELGSNGLTQAERGAVILLAQARPQRRPVDVGAGTQRAVNNAVAAALGSAAPPAAKPGSDLKRTAASPSPSGGLSHSNRPQRRPAGGRADRQSVEKAIAAAVSSGPLAPGSAALTALSSSPLPPRRSGTRSAAAIAAAAPQAAVAALVPTGPDQAAIEAQRREDAALQAQAEARARARAQADARAEAQARAAAEARARAQAEAEARAAAARNQSYTPPEAEKEPEVAVNIPKGSTSGTVAAAATVKDGITVNRTQIIGTIGAGKGSRALVRLSNGKIITLRLGDKINGGTITDIGNSRITYAKGGRSSQLAVLDGR